MAKAKGGAKGGLDPMIRDWDGVDAALRRMGEIEILQGDMEGEVTLLVNEVKGRFAERGKALEQEYKILEKEIAAFCKGKKAEFAVERTKIFNFGIVAYRITRSIVIGAQESCIAALRAMGLNKFVKVTEEVDKQGLADCDDDTLIKVGAERKTVDKLRIEPNLERIRSISA